MWNYQAVCIAVDRGKSPLNKTLTLRYLLAENVST